VISTQWTLKRPKNDQRPKKFSKAKFEVQRPKISFFFDFFTDFSYFAVNCSGKVIGLSEKAIKAAKRP